MIKSVVWILSLFTFSIYAADYSARVELSANSVSLVDDFIVTMHLTHPENAKPDVQTLTENLLRARPNFYLVDENVQQVDPFSTTLTWTLSPQTLGKTTFSFYNIPFKREGKPPFELISDLYSVTFTRPSKVENLVPLPVFSDAGPLKLNAENQRNLIVDDETRKWQDKVIAAKTLTFLELASFLAIVCLIAVIFFLFRSPQIQKKFRLKDPKKQALAALTDLQSKQLVQKQQFDLYYTELTSIVRRFIEKHYQVNATVKTTIEFFEEVKNLPNEEMLRDFLKAADKVKFAKKTPSVSDCAEAERAAQEFINSRS